MKNGNNFHPSLFRVAKDCSVIDANKQFHLAGALLEKASLNEKQIRAHLATGHIVRVGTSISEEAGTTQAVPVVNLCNPALGEGILTNEGNGHTQEDLLREGLVVVEDPEQNRMDLARNLAVVGTPKAILPEDHLIPHQPQQSRPTHQQISQWNLDPSALEGRNIDQLNVMVCERNPDQPIFNTPEEAIAFLSKDFKKA